MKYPLPLPARAWKSAGDPCPDTEHIKVPRKLRPSASPHPNTFQRAPNPATDKYVAANSGGSSKIRNAIIQSSTEFSFGKENCISETCD